MPRRRRRDEDVARLQATIDMAERAVEAVLATVRDLVHRAPDEDADESA